MQWCVRSHGCPASPASMTQAALRCLVDLGQQSWDSQRPVASTTYDSPNECIATATKRSRRRTSHNARHANSLPSTLVHCGGTGENERYKYATLGVVLRYTPSPKMPRSSLVYLVERPFLHSHRRGYRRWPRFAGAARRRAVPEDRVEVLHRAAVEAHDRAMLSVWNEPVTCQLRLARLEWLVVHTRAACL